MAATVHVCLSVVQDRANTGSTLPVAPAKPRAAETLTSGASSAAGNLVADEGDVWELTVTGGNVWVKMDTGNPNADSGLRRLLLDGAVVAYGADAGQKLAYKDA
jgi:hypothetical protein